MVSYQDIYIYIYYILIDCPALVELQQLVDQLDELTEKKLIYSNVFILQAKMANISCSEYLELKDSLPFFIMHNIK